MTNTDPQRGDMIAEAIVGWFGPRCLDTEPGCPICDAWAQYEDLRASSRAHRCAGDPKGG